MNELFELAKASTQVFFYKLDTIIELLRDLKEELEKINRNT
jgi:hypothetical protein